MHPAEFTHAQRTPGGLLKYTEEVLGTVLEGIISMIHVVAELLGQLCRQRANPIRGQQQSLHLFFRSDISAGLLSGL